ncbi:hypothetical protein EIP86_001820 [Pleurotus ostreatoroseus]|nr:hypothetical protein EIP86_001820 [Pleurotus ostreatoroseus]
MSFQPVKTAILGVGLSGLTFHAPFVLALPQYFKLTAVLERKPTSPGGKLAARFGEEAAKGVKIYNTLDQVLADSEIELVIVGTPSETHYEYTKRSLLAGKHVLCDKPITATFAEATELDQLAKSKKLVLYPYQNRRWDSDFLALRELLSLPPTDPNSLGAVFELESRFDRYRTALKGTWKDLPTPANGQTYDLGAHVIDQSLVLFGRPARISAQIENIRGLGSPEVDDNFTIKLHYPPRPAPPGSPIQPTSLTVVLRASILSVKTQQVRYIVRGTAGTFTKYGVDVQEDQLRVISSPSAIHTMKEYGVEPEEIHGVVENLRGEKIVKSVWPTKHKGDYAGLFVDVAQAIREGKPQAVKWEESAEVIELIELAYKASKEGRTLDVPPRA